MAAALVGGAFLSASLQVLFDRLASAEVVNFFRVRKHDHELLKKLKLQLLGLHAVLDDAEDKQITNLAVKEWVDELKDVIYHADDLLDEIAFEALRCKSEAEHQNSPNQVRSPTLTSSSSLFDAEIESKIKEIIGKLNYFAKEKDVLGLSKDVGQKWSDRLPTSSLVDEFGVYGRDNDKEDITKLLLSEEASGNQLDVIAIVGMGGVGKTALAQLLHNYGRVDDHFDMKAWVCVSDEFDVLRVTRKILEAVNPQGCNTIDPSKMDLNQLQVKLKECLSGKKFLIVLDDVWNENYDHWDILRSPFRYGGHGSKVIVTTRNESVSSTMQTVPIHRLQQLQDEDCWKLFAKHAFENGDCAAHPNLEMIGKEIVKKCKGLPLAAKTLGGLLRSKRNVEDWNNILKSGIWDLPKEKSNILPALRLSYCYLPSHLKRCFAYCSIFPKDYEFQMDRLIQMWMAEGFVEQPKSNKTKEECGYEYFNELLSRSFFQQSIVNKYGFVMHDLVNDLAHSVSGDFCYRLEDDKLHSISERLRHFSCAKGRFDGFQKFKLINEAKFLRTFLTTTASGKLMRSPMRWLSKKVLDDILPRLKCLRVLSLSCYEIMELPHSIGNLLHLRYLDLSYTKIKQLPESVCSMYNLETLLLRYCYHLTTLPAELRKLICLRHLDITGTDLQEMPMQMSQLKGLQHLTAFVVGKCKGLGIEELKEFHHLHGTLSISSLQNVTSGIVAMEAKLEEKMYLKELVLKWGTTANDSEKERDVIDKLRPHTNLKYLTIKNYGGTRFPDWLEDLSFYNIVSLHLDNCEYCFALPPLGQLPFLTHLIVARMQGITKVDHKFYGNGSLSKPFQSLKHLSFREMLEWVEWYILGVGEFPQLQELCVIKCPKLVGGLPKHIPSCVRVEIRECSRLMAPLPRTCGAGAGIGKLVLEGCDGIELGWRGVSSLVKLEISNMPTLKELTPELCNLTNLNDLKIEDCPNLLSFPDTGLPPMLTCISIINCEAIQSLPMGMMALNNCLKRLKKISVERCPKLVLSLSEEMGNCYKSLETLSWEFCGALKSMPLGFFPKLQSLTIQHNSDFWSIKDLNMIGLQNLTALESLFLNGLSNIVSFPQGGLWVPHLTHFSVWCCEKLKSLPEGMHTLFPALQFLDLTYCPEIESFPEGGLPSNLRSLEIRNCSKLTARRRDWNLQRLPSLRHFTLEGDDDLDFLPEDGVESFPEEGLLPSTLITLDIRFLSNLKSLNYKGLQLLGALKKMTIVNCPQLQSLPEEGLPNSLVMLEIFSCPMLKPRCLSEEGQDWDKIAHIPFLFIDFEAIFDQVTLGKSQYSDFHTLYAE